MNYEEAVAYIEETPKFTKKNSLEHTKGMFEETGNPQEKFKVIHVAGNEWKGEYLCVSHIYSQGGRVFLRSVYVSPSGEDQRAVSDQ